MSADEQPPAVPSRQLERTESGKLFVGGLSWETTEDSLKAYMRRFGEVEESTIKIDNLTGRSRGFGFVRFKNPEDAEKVLNSGPHTLDGKSVDPKRALPASRNSPLKTKKLFVGGLKAETTDERLFEHFSRYGQVVDIEYVVDKNSNKRRGFCFVEFDSEETANQVLEKTFHEIGGRMVEVKPAYTKEQQMMLALRGQWPHSTQARPRPLRYDQPSSAAAAYMVPLVSTVMAYPYNPMSLRYSSAPVYSAQYGHEVVSPVFQGHAAYYAASTYSAAFFAAAPYTAVPVTSPGPVDMGYYTISPDNRTWDASSSSTQSP